MPTYEKKTSPFGTEIVIRTDEDGSIWSFPTDPANSDYQRYLRWLSGEDENETLS